MTSVADNRGTTSLAYETGNDRVSSVTDPITGAVGYTYGLSGERHTMGLPGGGTWTYDYWETGAAPASYMPVFQGDDPNKVGPMLRSITDDQGRITEYRFDFGGRLVDAYWNQTYDQYGNKTSYCKTFNTILQSNLFYTSCRLSQIQNTYNWKPQYGYYWPSSVLTQNDYTYNAAGMRTANQISDVNGVVRTESYGYDELYRLTSVNYGDSHTQSYTFDAMGNRATKVNDGTSESYTCNAANMLLTRGANSYTNDLDGNTLTGGGRTNTWDSQNRLSQCVNGSTTTVNTYAADGIRHRMASTTSGVTTTRDSVLDASMFVREQNPSGGAEVNVATYLVGPRGPEYRRDDSTGAIRWYCYDGLGSVLGEVNTSGTLTATRSYDVYGSVRTSAGTSTSKHKFCGSLGHPSEDETGLVYMQARYLDPVTGRFVSEDPAHAGKNQYIYCSDDPVNRTDADGKIDNWAAAGFMLTWLALTNAGIAAYLTGVGNVGLAALMLVKSFAAAVGAGVCFYMALDGLGGPKSGLKIAAMAMGVILGKGLGDYTMKAALQYMLGLGAASDASNSLSYNIAGAIMQYVLGQTIAAAVAIVLIDEF